MQDHRAAVVLDAPIQVLDTAPAPNERAAQMLAILKDWRANGSIRIDADRNGFNDHPGVAILDAWWPRLADAVMTPVLGDLIPRLAELNSRGSAPEGTGNQSTAGWAGYVDKDLRTLARAGRRGPGTTSATAAPATWPRARPTSGRRSTRPARSSRPRRAPPTRTRGGRAPRSSGSSTCPNLIDKRIEFTNRPTFQQAISFRSGRK